jgi:hypothetical protein
MRTISPEALQKLQKHFGTEPIFILEVAWSPLDSARIAYSDQKIDGADYPFPAIVSVSNFDTALKITGASDTQSISIVLDDIDGQIKTIIDSQDIHKRPCWLYQTFKGLAASQKFLLFRGEISSPVVWDEGARTLSFELVTHVQDNEVAFSMEEGDFPNIPSDALGKVWPLVFGTVCNMEALKVRSPRKGYLAAGEGVHDFTLEPRICQARYIQCPDVPLNTTTTTAQTGTTIPLGSGTSSTVNGVTTVSNTGPDPTCLLDRFNTICDLLTQYDQQMAFEHASFIVKGGDKFPQATPITIYINGAKFQGSFTGETFYVTGRFHPDFTKVDHSKLVCHEVQDLNYGPASTNQTSAWRYDASSGTWKHDNTVLENCNTSKATAIAGDGGPTASKKALDDMPTASFLWCPAGSEVYLASEAEVLYIVSIIPGTINSVCAYKKQGKNSTRELLMAVPTDLYTVYETNYGGYTVVEIGFNEPLSQIDETWSDEIFVSFTSDVGPNPCDVIEWLVNKYATVTVDAASFATVKAQLANYPTNFYVKSKQSVFQTIQDVAYQSRCAVYVRDNVLYIKYLAAEPASVRTLTADDIVVNTFKIKYTESEDLETKQVISWRQTDAPVVKGTIPDQKIVLKHNVSKYGIMEADHNYYTQNTFDTILKSATFWLIRGANTWKTVEFDTPLSMLDLDVFDCITLNIDHLAPTPVKVIITSAQYNNESNVVHFECMTPIRGGEMTPYVFFWPATADPHEFFPLTTEEAHAGAGYAFTVTPPVGHILLGGDIALQDEKRVIMSSGDQHPSDIDDVYPVVFCEISDVMDFVEPDPVFEAWKRAVSSDYKNTDNQMNKGSAGGGGSKDKKKQRTACGDPAYGLGCLYEVTVTYINPRIVTNGHSGGGCDTGPCDTNMGQPCDGSTSLFCHTFGALFAATAFVAEMKGKIAGKHCLYRPGQWDPYLVSDIKAIPDPGDPFGGCETVPPGNPKAPMAGQGQTHEPKNKSGDPNAPTPPSS